MTQYWDGEGITGTYFADTDLGGLGYSGFVYDVYYVFGPRREADARAGRPRAASRCARAGRAQYSRRATRASMPQSA